ncbi:hypothetical protein COBT_002084 [Conglomerata obtusa]
MLTRELPPSYDQAICMTSITYNPTTVSSYSSSSEEIGVEEASERGLIAQHIFWPPLDQYVAVSIAPEFLEYKFIVSLRKWITNIYAFFTTISLFTFIFNIVSITNILFVNKNAFEIQYLLSILPFIDLFLVIIHRIRTKDKEYAWKLNFRVLLYGLVKIFILISSVLLFKSILVEHQFNLPKDSKVLVM